MSTQETSSAVDTASVRFVGQVKWFNNKAGYGFITARDGEHIDKDIFVHFSTVSGDEKQYRYLVQGEYVEFSIIPSNDTRYAIQAVSITGIKGGALMFETRRAQRADGEQRVVEGDAARPSAPRKYRTRTEGGERRRRPVRRNNEEKTA
jgi:cold shock CspA family protein